MDVDPSNANSKYLYNKIDQEINQVEILKAEGAKIHSKAQWREDSETSSRYFCSLEKKRGAEKSMRSVQHFKNGPIVTGIKDMLEQTRQFYVDLYTEERIEDDAQETILSKITLKLTKTQVELCKGAVTHDKITEAIKQTQNDKSLGTDALTYEFYKAFWHLVGKDLVQVFNNSFEQMRLLDSQNYGPLTLLFKIGERALLSNW